MIADDLVTVLEVYIESDPEPIFIACHIVVDAGLAPLLVDIYELTVHKKRDAYVCWFNYQLALHCLIKRVFTHHGMYMGASV